MHAKIEKAQLLRVYQSSLSTFHHFKIDIYLLDIILYYIEFNNINRDCMSSFACNIDFNNSYGQFAISHSMRGKSRGFWW